MSLRPQAYSGIGYAAGDGGPVWMTLDAGSSWTEGPNVGFFEGRGWDLEGVTSGT
ncbi:MAG: hypothetical protein M3680_32545 [Myxococcota bacterium]|nr:hypothetical protein [Myxococcota bacterium]